VEKHGTAKQSTDGYIIWRMRFACWVTKATKTKSEREYFLPLHGKNGSRTLLNVMFISTSPALFQPLLHSDQMLLSLLHCLHLQKRKALQCKMTVPRKGNFAFL